MSHLLLFTNGGGITKTTEVNLCVTLNHCCMYEAQSESLKTDVVSSKLNIRSIYAPNFEEVDGAYWFQAVRPSVHLFETCMPYFMNRAC